MADKVKPSNSTDGCGGSNPNDVFSLSNTTHFKNDMEIISKMALNKHKLKSQKPHRTVKKKVSLKQSNMLQRKLTNEFISSFIAERTRNQRNDTIFFYSSFGDHDDGFLKLPDKN